MQVTNPVGAMRSEMNFEERNRKIRVSLVSVITNGQDYVQWQACLVRTHHFNVPCITLDDTLNE